MDTCNNHSLVSKQRRSFENKVWTDGCAFYMLVLPLSHSVQLMHSTYPLLQKNRCSSVAGMCTWRTELLRCFPLRIFLRNHDWLHNGVLEYRYIHTYLYFNNTCCFFLEFDICRFCVIIRFFNPHHNGQWPPTSKDFYTRSYPWHYFLVYKGTTGTIFITSLEWGGPLVVIYSVV